MRVIKDRRVPDAFISHKKLTITKSQPITERKRRVPRSSHPIQKRAMTRTKVAHQPTITIRRELSMQPRDRAIRQPKRFRRTTHKLRFIRRKRKHATTVRSLHCEERWHKCIVRIRTDEADAMQARQYALFDRAVFDLKNALHKLSTSSSERNTHFESPPSNRVTQRHGL